MSIRYLSLVAIVIVTPIFAQQPTLRRSSELTPLPQEYQQLRDVNRELLQTQQQLRSKFMELKQSNERLIAGMPRVENLTRTVPIQNPIGGPSSQLGACCPNCPLRAIVPPGVTGQQAQPRVSGTNGNQRIGYPIHQYHQRVIVEDPRFEGLIVTTVFLVPVTQE